MEIEIQKLKEKLAEEYAAAYFGGGLDGAMAELSSLDSASIRELKSKARQLGINLNGHDFDER